MSKRKSWFRVLAVDPFSGMRVNVDRLVNGPPNPIRELWGHSVIHPPGARYLTNLIGPIKGDALLRKVNEQFLIRVIDLLVMQVVAYPWIRRMVSERLQLDVFQGARVEAPEKARRVLPPELVKEVGGVAWQKQKVELQRASGLVTPLSVPTVAAGLVLTGGSVLTVQLPSAAVYQASMVKEVSGPDQAEAMRLLSQLGRGGKMKREIGVSETSVS